MPTLGKTTIGASGPANIGGDFKEAIGPFLMPETGILKKWTGYIEGNNNGPGAVRVVMYIDLAGVADARVAYSPGTPVAQNQLPDWVDFFPTVDGIVLSQGASYWMGFQSDTVTAVMSMYDTVAGALLYNPDAYSDGPSDPFGSATSDPTQRSVYATYDLPSAPRILVPPFVHIRSNV